MNGPEPVVVETPVDPARIDGRAARSAKTRDAIADALLDLLAEGKLRPTAREIAEGASVSVRSVYVHFDDLEDLFCVAARRHFVRIAPMLEPVASTGALEERARALVSQRVRLYTKAGAVGRATQLHAESSPTLARLLSDARRVARVDLGRVFASELHSMGDAQRASTIAILDALTGPDTWQTLRTCHELTVDAAMQCVIDSIVVQLRATRP